MSNTGRFTWYDLITTDSEAATDFYTATTGWTASPWTGGEKPYTLLLDGERMVAGLMTSADTTPAWLGYVSVEDADATLERAERLGARACGPATTIPGVGRYAIITDPQGASIAILQPEGDAPTLKPWEGAAVMWHELHSTDPRAALRFYSELFGWKLAQELDIPGAGQYLTLRHAEDDEQHTSGAIFEGSAGQSGQSSWLYYLRVPDLDAALERAKAAGGTVLHGPDPVPGGRMAQCLDPQGGRFALFALG